MKININDVLFEMVTILDKKKERMKMIMTFTLKQGELFTADSIEKLDNNLQLKQDCIDDIECLDEAFEGHYKVFKDHSNEITEKCKSSDVTSALIKRLKEGTAEIQDFVKQIRRIESDNYKKAAKLMEIIQANLQASGREKKAVTVYGSNILHRASFDQRK